MRLITSAILTIALIAVTGCTQSPKKEAFTDPKEVIEAFDKLNSSTEVGVTYPKYIDKLTDVNTALSKYKESGKANQAQLELLQRAFNGYLIAGQLWGCDFKDNGVTEEYRCRDNQIIAASEILPDVASNKGIKEAISNKKSPDDFISVGLDKKGVLTLIWLSSQKQVILAKQ